MASAAAQTVDKPEPGSVEAIANATTEPRFLSPWVSYVPDSPDVPSPTDYLGHIVGAPGELTSTARIYGYYRALAAASPRVRVDTIGRSEEGREILLVSIADERNLAERDRHRAAMADLADPRRIDGAKAEALITSTRPFYLLHGGLHSTETGSPEMLMELAYRLAVSEEPAIRDIRERVIVLINPVAEPDGRDRMVEWFYRHLKGKTDYDNLPPISPPYWGKYVFHDNNRDGIQRKLALTRATQDAFLAWHPIVVHDLHESIPLLSIWTGTGPYNPNLDPSVFSEWHTIAFHEVATATALGMPGVWTYGFGEGFAHVFQDSVATNHNAIGRGYETFGNGTAETVQRRIDPERNRYTGRPVTESDWYRVVPPPKNFKWSLRNNTNYMQTAVLAALQYTARNAPEMMRNFWRRGENSVRKGRQEKPFAFVVPEQQTDRRRVAQLVNLLRGHGIEVSRATAAFKVGEGEYPAGTFVVRLDQPYRNFAVDLLTPQKYPADKAPYPAYDDVSWALPVSLGVEVKAIGDEAIKTVAVAPVTENVVLRAEAPAAGAYYLLADSGQEALLEARVRLSRFKVEAAEAKFTSDGREYPAGSWILADQSGLEAALGSLGGEPRASVRHGGGRARRRAPRARSAAARRPADLDLHAVGRLGADDLRRPEGALHADHGRRRAEGRPALALRRDPLPGDERQPASNRRWHRPEVRAARLHEDRGVSLSRHADRLVGHHRRHHVGGPRQHRHVRARGRRAAHARQLVHASCRRRHRARRDDGRGVRCHEPWQRAARALPTPRTPDCVRLSRDHFRLPRGAVVSARASGRRGTGGPAVGDTAAQRRRRDGRGREEEG